jgi:hypothetical protein
MPYRHLKFPCPYCQGQDCQTCKNGTLETTYHYHGKSTLTPAEAQALDELVATLYNPTSPPNSNSNQTAKPENP